MRAPGEIRTADGLGEGAHACWAYDDPAELAAAAVAFLADGLALGRRLLLVGPGTDDELRAAAARVGDVAALEAAGRLSVASTADRYAGRMVPDAQVRAYVAATRDAMAAGHTGLRVVADVTELVLDAAACRTFARYEHLVDREVASGLPFDALCAVDARRLGPAGVAELARVHPLSHGADLAFRLHAGPDRGLVLAGEVDLDQEPELAHVLAAVLADRPSQPVVVDCADLGFIDHRGLLALDHAADRAGTPVELVGASGVVRRVRDLLALPSVTVVAP